HSALKVPGIKDPAERLHAVGSLRKHQNQPFALDRSRARRNVLRFTAKATPATLAHSPVHHSLSILQLRSTPWILVTFKKRSARQPVRQLKMAATGATAVPAANN